MSNVNLPDIAGPTLPADEIVDITIAPLDVENEAAELDAIPTWSVSTNGTLSAQGADGLTASVKGLGAKAGDTVVVTVTALSEGDTITQNINFPVGPGELVSMGPAFSAAHK
jgi:hypothetical protein